MANTHSRCVAESVCLFASGAATGAGSVVFGGVGKDFEFAFEFQAQKLS